jgi:hypothetical protein
MKSSHTRPKGELVKGSEAAREHGVCGKTWSRWQADPAIGLPKPVIIGTREYFIRAELDAWKSSRPRASEAK